MSFYKKRRKPLVLGENGVSKYFMLGLLEITGDRAIVANGFKRYLNQIKSNPYFEGIESHTRRSTFPQYWVHAKDDAPEIRQKVFEWLLAAPLRFTAVAIRKDHLQFDQQFERKERRLYAHVLSHLAKAYCDRGYRVVFHLAFLGGSTSDVNLQEAFIEAQRLYEKDGTLLTGAPDFHNDVQKQSTLPMLGAVDYCCWALQRFLEKGEHRFLQTLDPLISQLTILDADKQGKQSQTYFSNPRQLIDHIKKSPHPG